MVLQWIAIVSVVAFIFWYTTKGIPVGAPPGPRRIPFFGNLHQLGSDPVIGLTKIAKDYPEVPFQLQKTDI